MGRTEADCQYRETWPRFRRSDFRVLPVFLVVPAKDGRSKATGRLADGTIVAIFVNLGSEALSIISMRPARKDERSMIR